MVATQLEAQSVTRGGRPWQPSYLLGIDPETCIGCGRCFKVCGRSVMDLKALRRMARSWTSMATTRFCARS